MTARSWEDMRAQIAAQYADRQELRPILDAIVALARELVSNTRHVWHTMSGVWTLLLH